MIDTSILIAGEKAKLSPGDLIAARRKEECFISAITASELLVGVHRAPDAAIKLRRSVHVEALLDHFAVVPIDLPIARAHAQLWAELASRGTPIGPQDLWLAASAIAHGFSIATLNLREFERVPGLVVERWGS